LNDVALTIYGVTALTFMMAMYALERRHRGFVLAFAIGCMLASSYGFLSGAWPFGAVEAIWSLVALRRFRVATRESRQAAGRGRAAAPDDGASR
jgi:hypothetical protein